VTSQSYDIPTDFDANSYLASAWGIVADGELQTVKLRFDPKVATIIEEVVWHPSQMVERQPDGSAIVTLTVLDTVELHSWILSWGENVEVLEPVELREEIAETARAMLDVYEEK
jgi:predicted DNA-binding transcriptional regulator YafY